MNRNARKNKKDDTQTKDGDICVIDSSQSSVNTAELCDDNSDTGEWEGMFIVY